MKKITTIKQAVRNDLLSYTTKQEKEQYLKEIIENNGCQNGCSSLNYYTDITPFYEAAKADINDIIAEEMESYEIRSLKELIPELDVSDPLNLTDQNICLIVWNAYTYVCQELAS